MAKSMPEAAGFFHKAVRKGDYSSHRTSMSQRHPVRTRSHPRIRNPSTYPQLQQIGDENGGPPGRYRPARCGNPNLWVVQPAPPGKESVPSSDQKSFHTSTAPTNQGRKRWSHGSIPLRTVWKPQPGGCRASTNGGGYGNIHGS